MRPGSGHLCPWQESSRESSPPLPFPSPCQPASPGLWPSQAFPPAGPRGLLPLSLLPSFPPSLKQHGLRAGWEEISLEFPFHTSRLNFLSVSPLLAVCSFSCHRKCQAKVRASKPPGFAAGGFANALGSKSPGLERLGWESCFLGGGLGRPFLCLCKELCSWSYAGQGGGGAGPKGGWCGGLGIREEDGLECV